MYRPVTRPTLLTLPVMLTVMTLGIGHPSLAFGEGGVAVSSQPRTQAAAMDAVLKRLEERPGSWKTTGPTVKVYDRNGKLTAKSLATASERFLRGTGLRNFMTAAAQGPKSIFGRNIAWFGEPTSSKLVGSQRGRKRTTSGDVVTRITLSKVIPDRSAAAQGIRRIYGPEMAGATIPDSYQKPFMRKKKIRRSEVVANEKVGTKITVHGIRLAVTRQKKTMHAGTVKLRRVSSKNTGAFDQVFDNGARFRTLSITKARTRYTKK